LEQVAHEDDPLHIMRALDKEGWLKVLHPHWSMAKIDGSELGQLVKTRQTMNDLGYSVETGPIVMYFLTRRMNDKDVSEIQRMIPRRDFVDKWKHLEHRAHDLAKKLTNKEAGTPSGSWRILTKASPEDMLFLSLTVRQQAVDQKLKNFFGKWRQVKEKLPFPEMAELRITSQLPEYQKILDDAFLLLLDGKLRSHTEIMHFLKPYEPPPPPPPPPVKRGRGKAVATAATPAPATAAAPAGKRGRKAAGGAVPAPPTPVPSTAPVPEAKPGAGAKKAPVPAVESKKAVQAPVATAAVPKKSPAKSAKKDKQTTRKAAPKAKKAAPRKKSALKKRPGAKKPAPRKAAKKAGRKVTTRKAVAGKPAKRKR
jgi:tRNA nucleotidyltransferase (CCA-adding enzyme)